MSNDESLSLVESAIADTEAELGKLDSLNASAQASQTTIKELENTVFELHNNHAGLDQKARANKLTSATSMLNLERGDQATFKAQIDAQSNRVVQVGQRAKSLLQQVWSAVLQSRKSNVTALIEANFDLQRLHIPAAHFPLAAFSVIEVEEIQGTLFQYRYLPTERDLAIDDARKLRTRSTGLLTMAVNEPGLELDIVNVEVAPIPKPKPTVAGNQLGTLAQAVAA